MNNPFLPLPPERIIYSSEHYHIVKDLYPVSLGHLLIISKLPKETFFDLSHEEQAELSSLIHQAKSIIEEEYSPDGYNIGINCGAAAGQTVFHFHCHVIPRYKGDMDDPRGGIRHCVKGRGRY